MYIGKVYYSGKEVTPVLSIYPHNNQDTKTKAIYINQTGYDIDKSKRATITNIIENTPFYVKDSNNKTVFVGVLQNQIADFSKFKKEGTYHIECAGITSYDFKIAKDRLLSVGLKPALLFMEQSRQEKFCTGGDGKEGTGYAWRDSHQFSFELNSLVMQYMSNPSYYNSLEKNVYKANECDFEELHTQTEPNLVWLIKYGALRYYDMATNQSIKLHALIKGQLAWFLYGYPYYSKYVSKDFYQKIRKLALECWDVSECNKTWYDTETNVNIDHNMFSTQNQIGSTKGNCPPGYAVIPNLLMYKVALRDNLGTEIANKFKTAFLNNLNWLLSLDLTDPQYLKGQRMSELQVVLALTQSYEFAKELCPESTLTKIEELADIFIKRSNNMWDYKVYQSKEENNSTDIWVNAETSGGLCNQPGNTYGLLAECFSIAKCLTDKDKIKKLKEIGISNYDHCFGRNPLGRCFSYTATTEIEDAKVNWVKRLSGGYGALDDVYGTIDGAPKNANYPYNPSGDTGYTEAWVVWNTCWNVSLAYLCGDSKDIQSVDIFQ